MGSRAQDFGVRVQDIFAVGFTHVDPFNVRDLGGNAHETSSMVGMVAVVGLWAVKDLVSGAGSRI